MFEIVLKQTLLMLAYMFAGFVVFKSGKITKEGTKSLSNLLIYFIFPTVVIKSFRREFSSELFTEFLIGFCFCIIGILISMAVSRIFFSKRPVECFATSFPNSGFFGVPLITAVLGEQFVIYAIGTSSIVGTLQHSYGVKMITGERKFFSLKVFLLAPNFVATVAGIVLFSTNAFSLFPPLLNNFIDGVSALNAPVVMIILGSYLAQSDLKKMFVDLRLYLVSLVRLIIIPIIAVLVYSIIPVNNMIKFTVATCLATPCGTNVAVYCQLHDKDYPFACQTVAMSTLIGMFTIPVVANFAQKIFGI